MRLAFDPCKAGGEARDLIPLLGLSKEQWRSFRQELTSRLQPRQPTLDTPILIPATTPTSYISFVRALNLRLRGEWTGDWHFHTSFFGYPDSHYAPLAGHGGLVDTTPSLGTHGVRDMARVIAAHKIKPYDGPVYVANHFRAIADMAMDDIQNGPLDGLQEEPLQMIIPACTIKDYLDTKENIEHLVSDYLMPLRGHLEGDRRDAFDIWIPTVTFA